jgi:ethanolamine transporter EutH
VRVLNPFMPLWWAMAMPGAGHIMLGKMVKGFIFFIFEMVVNNQAHLNTAIVYSLIGQFQLAKESLDIRWFFIYSGVYIFNAWDAYRLCTDINQFSMLAIRAKSPIPAFHLSLFEINYLQKLNMWIPILWSLVAPGIGHIILRNIIPGFYLFAWYIVVIYKSKLLEGVYYSFLGYFSDVRFVMDFQWTLFIPSVYLFSVCDSYYRCIEQNELFKIEQARFLEKKYKSITIGSFIEK